MADETIRVAGLKDLQKALRDIDRDLPKELAAGLAEASEIVVRAASAKVPFVSGAARASMKPRKQQRGAAIAVGGTKAPYYPWLEWGGAVGRNRSVKRPFIRKGRYLYPTLAEKSPEVKAKVDEVLERLAIRAGFNTRGKG